MHNGFYKTYIIWSIKDIHTSIRVSRDQRNAHCKNHPRTFYSFTLQVIERRVIYTLQHQIWFLLRWFNDKIVSVFVIISLHLQSVYVSVHPRWDVILKWIFFLLVVTRLTQSRMRFVIGCRPLFYTRNNEFILFNFFLL